MGRPKGSRNKVVPTTKRLYDTEQVLETKEQAVGFGVKEVYQPYGRLSASQIRDLIIACAWIEDCANAIADEVIKYPLQTVVDGDESKKDKEIEAFLNYPSMVEPLFTIRKKYIKDMIRYGNGALTIAYQQNKPTYLIPVPGYTLRVSNNNPPKYKLESIDGSGFKQKGGKDIVLSNKEVIHFQIDADSDKTLARSPLDRIYSLVQADKNISQKLQTFTSKGFFKPSFLSIDKANGKDVETFVEYLNQMVSEGAKIFGINKEAVLKEIPFWDSNDIIEMQKWLGLRIANAFKVPPFMLNLVQDTGSLNAREQRARFCENVVLPILQYESYLYTMKVAKQAFKKNNVEIKAPTMGLILNYNKVRTAAMTIRTDESLLTVDEARRFFLGLDEKKITE